MKIQTRLIGGLIIAALMLPALPAAAVDVHWPSKGSKLMLPVTDPCTESSEGGDLPVPSLTCEQNKGFYLDLQVLDEGIGAGLCDDGDNDDTPCLNSGDCTGDGNCEPVCRVVIWAVASETAPDVAVADVWAQASPADSSYSANEGVAQGLPFTGSDTVAAAAGTFFPIVVDNVKPYDDLNETDCTIEACKNVSLKVLIRNGSTVEWEALSADFVCPAP